MGNMTRIKLVLLVNSQPAFTHSVEMGVTSTPLMSQALCQEMELQREFILI